MEKVPREKAQNFENSLAFAFGVGPVLSKRVTQIQSTAGFLTRDTMDTMDTMGLGNSLL